MPLSKRSLRFYCGSCGSVDGQCAPLVEKIIDILKPIFDVGLKKVKRDTEACISSLNKKIEDLVETNSELTRFLITTPTVKSSNPWEVDGSKINSQTLLTQQSSSGKNGKSRVSTASKAKITGTAADAIQSKSAVDKAGRMDKVQESNLLTMKIMQQQIMDKCVNLDGGSGAISPSPIDRNIPVEEMTSRVGSGLPDTLLNPLSRQQKELSDGFNLVRSRRQRKQAVSLGTAETASDGDAFEGRDVKPRKAWLFISRVKDNTSEDVVRSYIKKKTGVDDGDISVKSIETNYERKDSKCFQVGIRFELKDKLYSSDFWPSGVAFRRFRFDFNRGKDGQRDFHPRSPVEEET